MSWFVSRHTRWLEKEVERLHAEIAEREKTHAEEMSRAITSNDRLRDELQRTRILLTPGIANVALPHEYDAQTPDESLNVFEVPTGTPWMRLQAKYAKEQAEQEAKEKAAAALKTGAAKGEVNGNAGEGRNPIS